jgi:carotenoid cleavage dioxygenase-like enzyme
MKNSERAKITPFSLRGNFAPVRKELQYKPAKVLEGKLPTDL